MEEAVRRRIRVLGILDGARRVGLDPLPTRQLHAAAYFADALAPVWDLRILDAQLLKRSDGPISLALQRDLDRLVGMGVVRVMDVRHVEDEDGNWRLDARYSLNDDLAKRILDTAADYEATDLDLSYMREVVYALSGLGAIGIERATRSDASYGDVHVDIGDMVDIAGDGDEVNLSSRVANRIQELMESDVSLTDAEQVHLYVREIYSRVDLGT